MLYDRWRQIAQMYRAERALSDTASGASWTFGQLADAADAGDKPDSQIAYLRGHSADFVLAVLRAWKAGLMVCPLEINQPTPDLASIPDRCTHFKMTSATTGSARVVAFTGEQLAADADNIVATMGLRPEWPNLGVISLAHSYGFSNLVTPLLLHGIPLIIGDSPLPEVVKAAAAGYRAITLPAVPALWRTWHDTRSIPENVTLAISAGAPLPLQLEGIIHSDLGLKIHNFMGASECGGIAYDASDLPRSDATLAGASMKNIQLSIDGEGCLVVQGRSVGETYLPEADPKLGHGRYQSSDLAELRNGNVYLRGRSSDQINVAGRKVSPENIEQMLLAHAAVRDCLVFGAPSGDTERGETIVACIVARTPVSTDELKHHLLEVLPAWQVPRQWLFRDTLTPNQRGKLSRSEWRKHFMENGGAK
jgi:acyl-CoA synthetase (AMP-forming)/AMP-acid ligase II